MVAKPSSVEPVTNSAKSREKVISAMDRNCPQTKIVDKVRLEKRSPSGSNRKIPSAKAI